MPYAGIQHSSFDYFRRQLRKRNEDLASVQQHSDSHLSNKQLVLAGSLAGGLSVVCTYPLDILRARLVVQQGNQPSLGLLHTFIKTYREQVSTLLCVTGIFPVM